MELGSFVLEELLLSLPRPSFVGSLAHEGLPDAAQPEGIFAGRGHGSVAFELASELDFEPLSGDNYEEGPTALAD
jgi:hypothetical protein